MDTAITQTSVEAYHTLNLCPQRQEVLQAIRTLGESCIADIANYLGWEKSTVAPRLNELKQMKWVVYVCKQKSKTTGDTSEFWRARAAQGRLF